MNILTLSKNLGYVRLDQLDEALYTKIIMRVNQVLPEGYQIASNMCGVDISNLYLTMPTDVKTSCLPIILIDKKEQAFFLNSIKVVLDHIDMMQEHDNAIKDYTISIVAMIILISTFGLIAFYMATTGFRGEVPDSSVLLTIAKWIHALTSIDVT